MRYDYLVDLGLYYQSHEEHTYLDLNGDPKKELLIAYETNRTAPGKTVLFKEPFFLFYQGNRARIRLPIVEAELKHFFDNYKDYYYLPDEDMCVLKSVAHAVSPDHRENAKKETCYIRYSGFFIPLLHADLPSFRQDYKSRMLFEQYHPEEVTPDFCDRIGATILHYLNA